MKLKVYMISQDDNKFVCYYPAAIFFALQPNETVVLISDNKVYIERWVEEGRTENNGDATDYYRYYNEILIKDYAGAWKQPNDRTKAYGDEKEDFAVSTDFHILFKILIYFGSRFSITGYPTGVYRQYSMDLEGGELL